MVADMEADKVVDMEVNMMADMEVDTISQFLSDFTIFTRFHNF